jgi:hypothetical protein
MSKKVDWGEVGSKGRKVEEKDENGEERSRGALYGGTSRGIITRRAA